MARLNLLQMPLERDEGEYAYAGQLILQGIPPYDLAYNMKLPGTYYMYALGMALFGQTIPGIHLTLLVANLLTIVFVFFLGKQLFDVTVGAVAGASYGIMTLSPVVLGSAAHATHFVVLFAIPAVMLLLAGTKSARPWFLFFSGVFFGIAFLMKQQGIVFGLFGGVYLIYQSIQNNVFTRSLIARFCFFSAGAILPFALLCLYLQSAGIFDRFWFWTFTYAHSYASEMDWKNGFNALVSHWNLAFPYSAGFWLLGAAGIVLGVVDREIRGKIWFVGVLWLFSFLGVAIGFYFREHYFVLILPAFSLLIGVGISQAKKRLHCFNVAFVKTVPMFLFLIICGITIFCQRRFFSIDGLRNTIYFHVPLKETVVVSDYLRSHSGPSDRIAVLGSEPQIYFYAQRHSATGYIYTYPLMEPQPNALQMQREMMSEIETNKPKYLIWINFKNSWHAFPSSDQTILKWGDRYTSEFYEIVGLANWHPDGTTYIWDKDLERSPEPFQESYVAIFRRRDVVQNP